MQPRLLITSLLTTLILSACGGGGNDDNTSDFTPADGNSSYTGQRTLAALNTGNAAEYLSMLYGPGFETPSLSFRSTQSMTLAGNDFLSEQNKLLQHLKQQALPTQYMQRSVNSTENCENEGKLTFTGNAEDGSSKAKINLNYHNCQFGEYIFDGNAYLIIYATNSSFDEISSATISYNGLQATPVNGAEPFTAVGTLDEVVDYNTGSTRLTVTLHRQTISTGKQTFISSVNQYYAVDDTVRANGTLYHGIYGRANLSTLQPAIYDAYGNPLSGSLLLKGANNSKIRVTALGEQYSLDLDRYLLLLQVEVDADGDGIYESLNQSDVDDL
ncbi:MAG: hypothetical protein R3F02_00340 [Thiolinea sp.]